MDGMLILGNKIDLIWEYMKIKLDVSQIPLGGREEGSKFDKNHEKW